MLFKEELAIANAATSSAGNHGAAQNALNVSGGGANTPSTVEALAAGFKNTEVISILKRRNNSSENVNDNLKYTTSTTAVASAAIAVEDNSLSLHSQTYSDSSLQKYDDDDHHGRDHDDDDDDESDSDWDGFPVRSTLALSQFVLDLNFTRFSHFLFQFRIANEAAVVSICPISRVRFFEKFPMF